MKLVIEVIVFGRTLKFRERATRVVFDKLLAYRIWVNGSYRIYDQEKNLLGQGHIKSLGPYYSIMSGFSGMSDLIREGLRDNEDFLACCQGSSLIKALPKFFEPGFEIHLDVPSRKPVGHQRYGRFAKPRYRVFDFRKHLEQQAEFMGECKVAQL